MTYVKPDYCIERNYECSKCELFKDYKCSLLEEHIEILQYVNDRKKLIKKDKL